MLKQYKNIICVRAGIWNKNEKLSITNPAGGAAEYMFENSLQTDEMINGMTMQSLLEFIEWNEVDIIKLDIEGAEKEVFSADHFIVAEQLINYRVA